MTLWFYEDFDTVSLCGRTRWRSCLKHCVTSRMVEGSVPDGFTGIFHWLNPSDRIMSLESTQLLTKMITRNTSWDGKCGWCVELTALLPWCLEIWEPQPPVQACVLGYVMWRRTTYSKKKKTNFAISASKKNLMYSIRFLDNLTGSRQM